MAAFEPIDCPPFCQSSLKQEIMQAYVKLGKRQEALLMSQEVLQLLANGDKVEYVRAQQRHGFQLLQDGSHDEVLEAQRIFQATLDNEMMAGNEKDFPIERIDYEKVMPISKVGLGISLALRGTRPIAKKIIDSSDEKRVNTIPPVVEITGRDDVERALGIFYGTLPVLYDDEETFYVSVCLIYASIIHEASGSIEKATEALKKLKSWISDHVDLQGDINLSPADVDRWIERVRTQLKDGSK